MGEGRADLANGALGLLHPVTAGWFRRTYGEPTAPQRLGWPSIRSGAHTLLLAPTGSGKTLAAFCIFLDRLFARSPGGGPGGEAGRARPAAGGEGERAAAGVRVVYLSPLKALDNDIHRNLEGPLAGLAEAFRAAGLPCTPPRAEVRTGDTPAPRRQAMLRRPPEILITTPESLFLLLSSPRSREVLRTVEAVIVDEIHAVAGEKRGAHLALSLERLEALAGHPVQRVGLSATLRPLEEVARLLGGDRPVRVVEAGTTRPLDLLVDVPVHDLRALPEGGVWPPLVERLLQLVRAHRSTLIFVNNRGLAERLAARLNQQAGEALARSHHGSLSRAVREEVEADLKAGRLRALVSTASLELGIDIGAVDLVVQVESPGEAARGLQRVGRAGHGVGGVSKGRILPKSCDDLLEAAAVARAMVRGDIEAIQVPRSPLDVLAQHLVAMAAVEEWSVPDAFRLVRRAYPYAQLAEETFRSVVALLADGVAHPALGHVRPRITWDRVADRIAGGPGARLLAVTNAGTIPDRGLYPVVLEGTPVRLGELDEEFVHESRVGDAFRLGSSTWRIVAIRSDRVEVTAAPGAVPRLPFWRGEGLGRSPEVGRQVGALMREIDEALAAGAAGEAGAAGGTPARGAGRRGAELERLAKECRLSPAAARNLFAYLADARAALGVLPHDRRVVVEVFRDTAGDHCVVIHSPFGRRIHAGLALLLQDWLRTHLGLRGTVLPGDSGLVLRFPGTHRAPPVDLLGRLDPGAVGPALLRELEGSPLFGALFREAARRALLLPRRPGRRREPRWLQRLRAQDLLDAARDLPGFPLLAEVVREALYDVLAYPLVQDLVKALAGGTVTVEVAKTRGPSPLAAQLLFQYAGAHVYEDDTPRADRAARLLEFAPALLALPGGEAAGALLHPSAVEQVEAELQGAAGAVQDPAGLEALLRRTGDRSEAELARACGEEWRRWVEVLVAGGRAERVGNVYIPAGEATSYRVALAGGGRGEAAEGGAKGEAAGEEALLALVRRYAALHGPFAPPALARRYGLPPERVAAALQALAARGELVAGRFRAGEAAGQEWVHPAVLTRLHHASLAAWRRAASPASPEAYARFLLAWQGAARAAGDREVAAADLLACLEGVDLPLTLWEELVLPARGLRGGEVLEELVRSGRYLWRVVGWPGGEAAPRVTFFRRGTYPYVAPPAPTRLPPAGTEEILGILRARGALFREEVAAALPGSTREAVQRALLQLVAAGWVANDSLGPLRRLAFPGRSTGLVASGGGDGQGMGAPEAGGRPPGAWPPLDGQLRRARRAAARRVARRLRATVAGAGTETGGEGRWFCLPEPVAEPAARARAVAALLLRRYGVIARETFAAWGEGDLWEQARAWLERGELVGELRRGYFVQGLSGVQYALPAAADQLQALQHTGPAEEVVLLSVLDPANPYGLVLPWPEAGSRSFRRGPGTFVVLEAGGLRLVVEGYGRRLVPVVAGGETWGLETWTRLLAPLSRLLPLLGREGRLRKRLVVEQVGDTPVHETPAAPALARLGFRSLPGGMALDGWP